MGRGLRIRGRHVQCISVNVNGFRSLFHYYKNVIGVIIMLVEMRNIKKSFGANLVLKNVTFQIDAGEVLGLLGENGAGKSTLMNILGGVHQMDGGAIYIDGEKVHFQHPIDSLHAGIAFIHQELNLINDLPIYENIFIGREPKTKWGSLDFAEMIKETQRIFDEIGIQLDPKIRVEKLDASYKQIVEICRALLMDASLIIMDEPTTSLTEKEIERVFFMMNKLKERGVSIIFISHKLNEVKQFCDTFVMLRNGNLVAEGRVEDVTTRELSHHMVGFDVRTSSLRRTVEFGPEMLRLEAVSDGVHFKNINLAVRSGEILGVTGLLGDGRSELFQAVFGSEPIKTGAVYVQGEKVRINSTFKALSKGIAYLPRNRKENAIISDMSIIENASVATWDKFAHLSIINEKQHHTLFEQQRQSLKIKMDRLTDKITSLSGGNQQKVVIAKWLATSPNVLILDNPTQGVDVGAKEDIYDIILELANRGIAVIILSGEAQEIIRICDRALIMYHGHIQGELLNEEMTEQNMMHLSTGGEMEVSI